MTRRALAALVALAALLALTSACGGSSGPTSPDTLDVTFAADAVTAGSVGLRQIPGALRDGVGPERVLALEVVATDLVDVGSLTFTVQGPVALVRGDRSVLGPFLAQAGVAVQSGGSIGEASVRLELSRPDGVGGASGSGVIATVDFLLRAAGEGRVDIVDAEARASDGTLIAAVSFSGGVARVR